MGWGGVPALQGQGHAGAAPPPAPPGDGDGSVVLEEGEEVVVAAAGEVGGAQVGQQLVGVRQLRQELGAAPVNTSPPSSSPPTPWRPGVPQQDPQPSPPTVLTSRAGSDPSLGAGGKARSAACAGPGGPRGGRAGALRWCRGCAGWLPRGVLCSPGCTGGWDGSIRPGGGNWERGERSGETLPELGPPWRHGGWRGEPLTHSPADLCGERGHRGLLGGQEATGDVRLVGDGGWSWREVTECRRAGGTGRGEGLGEAPRSRKGGTCGRKGGDLGELKHGQGPSPFLTGPSHTRGGIVGSSARGWWRQRREGCRTGPQGCNHLHDVGQHHVRGAERAAPLQRRPLRFLFHMDIGFDRDGFPAAGRVDGDLLVLGAEDDKGWGSQAGELAARPPRGGAVLATDRRSRDTYFWMWIRMPSMYWSTSSPSSKAVLLQAGRGRVRHGEGRETEAQPHWDPTHLQTGQRHVPLSQLSCRYDSRSKHCREERCLSQLEGPWGGGHSPPPCHHRPYLYVAAVVAPSRELNPPEGDGTLEGHLDGRLLHPILTIGPRGPWDGPAAEVALDSGGVKGGGSESQNWDVGMGGAPWWHLGLVPYHPNMLEPLNQGVPPQTIAGASGLGWPPQPCQSPWTRVSPPHCARAPGLGRPPNTVLQLPDSSVLPSHTGDPGPGYPPKPPNHCWSPQTGVSPPHCAGSPGLGCPTPCRLWGPAVPLTFGDAVLSREQALLDEPLQHGAHRGPVHQLQHEQVGLRRDGGAEPRAKPPPHRPWGPRGDSRSSRR